MPLYQEEHIRTMSRDGRPVRDSAAQMQVEPGLGEYDFCLRAPFPAIEMAWQPMPPPAGGDGSHAEECWFSLDYRRWDWRSHVYAFGHSGSVLRGQAVEDLYSWKQSAGELQDFPAEQDAGLSLVAMAERAHASAARGQSGGLQREQPGAAIRRPAAKLRNPALSVTKRITGTAAARRSFMSVSTASGSDREEEDEEEEAAVASAVEQESVICFEGSPSEVDADAAPSDLVDILTNDALTQVRAQAASRSGDGSVRIWSWDTRYAQHLGPLRSFIERFPEEFVVTPGKGKQFSVALAPTRRAGAVNDTAAPESSQHQQPRGAGRSRMRPRRGKRGQGHASQASTQMAGAATAA